MCTCERTVHCTWFLCAGDQACPSRSRPVGSHYRNWKTQETAAVGRDDSVTQKPELDAFGREYARLAFGIERHVPGFIDAYLGPDDVRAALDPEDPAGAP